MYCSNCGTQNSQEMKFCGHCGTEFGLANELSKSHQDVSQITAPNYSGFWLRVVACTIDLILSQALIFVLAILILLPSIFTMAPTSSQDEVEIIDNLIGFFLGVFIPWIYYTVAESSKWQATPGKKMLGLVVVDKEGRKISFGRANARYWAKILSVFIFFIGYVMIAFTKKKQGLHDKIADTYVVRN